MSASSADARLLKPLLGDVLERLEPEEADRPSDRVGDGKRDVVELREVRGGVLRRQVDPHRDRVLRHDVAHVQSEERGAHLLLGALGPRRGGQEQRR